MLMCYLGRNGGTTTVYGLVRNVKIGKDAVIRGIDTLERLGLCETRHSARFPFPRTVSLTPEGQALLDTRIRDPPGFFWKATDGTRRRGPKALGGSARPD